MSKKVRFAYLSIERDEFKKFSESNAESLIFKAEVHHSRIVLSFAPSLIQATERGKLEDAKMTTKGA